MAISNTSLTPVRRGMGPSGVTDRPWDWESETHAHICTVIVQPRVSANYSGL